MKDAFKRYFALCMALLVVAVTLAPAMAFSVVFAEGETGGDTGGNDGTTGNGEPGMTNGDGNEPTPGDTNNGSEPSSGDPTSGSPSYENPLTEDGVMLQNGAEIDLTGEISVPIVLIPNDLTEGFTATINLSGVAFRSDPAIYLTAETEVSFASVTFNVSGDCSVESTEWELISYNPEMLQGLKISFNLSPDSTLSFSKYLNEDEPFLDAADWIYFSHATSSEYGGSTSDQIWELLTDTTLTSLELIYDADAHDHQYTLVPAADGTCQEAGHSEHYVCSVCGKTFLLDGEVYVEQPAAYFATSYGDHDYVFCEEMEPSCQEPGMSAQYECSVCGAYFIEEGQKYTEVSEEDLLIPMVDHQLQHEEGSEGGCLYGEDGIRPHWYCEACESYFIEDTNGEMVEVEFDDLLIPAVHNYVWVAEVPATCEASGMSGHYECSVCGRWFLFDDAASEYVETNSEDLTLPPLGHTYVTVDGTPATCTTTGLESHVECSVCGKVFVAKDGGGYREASLSDFETPLADHSLVHQEGVSPTCEEGGLKDYYICSECDQMFVLENNEPVPVTEDDLYLEPSDHEYEYVEEVPSTCKTEGTMAHYVCAECGRLFVLENQEYREVSPEELVLPKSDHTFEEAEVVPSTCSERGYRRGVCTVCGEVAIEELEELAPHTLVLIPETDSTCSKRGNIEYYVCSECQGRFILSDGEYEPVDLEDVLKPLDPDHHTGEVLFKNRESPRTDKPGYSGDTYCGACGVLLEQGTELPALTYSEDMTEEEKQEVKEVAANNLDYIISRFGEELIRPEVREALGATSVETILGISDFAVGAADDVMEAYKDLPEEETHELQPGVELTKGEALEVLFAVTEATVLVAGSQDTAVKKADKTEKLLPKDNGLNLKKTVNVFYIQVLHELMGLVKPSRVEGPGHELSAPNGDWTLFPGMVILLGKEEENTEASVDYSVSPETYQKAVEFVDVSVNNMQQIALRIRECSGEAMRASINRYITGVSSQSFRDFDREKADEEFAQAAYEAVLVSLQSTVLANLEKNYQEARKGKSGKALEKLTAEYEKEKEQVSHLHFLEGISDEECDGCFEDIVIEVMRQKFISIMDERYLEGSLEESVYIEYLEKTQDVVTFTPVYKEIFHCWVLNEEDTSEIQISMETLSNATIETTTQRIQPKGLTVRKLTTGEIIAFSSIAAAVLLVLAAYVVKPLKKREVV